MSIEEETLSEETLGPGTDLVISLFSTFLLLGILGAALGKSGEDPPPPPPAPPSEDVIALDPVRDGFQHFKRQSAELEPRLVPMIVEKLRPLQVVFEAGKGQLLVHVIGHASPEPFGSDDGVANFRLALDRAMTIADLAHRELGIPFECLRVHGYGRGESASLKSWIASSTTSSLGGWDSDYRRKREQEKLTWGGGQEDWKNKYAAGQTELGKELSGERRVVLKTERASGDLCAQAFAERPLQTAQVRIAARVTPRVVVPEPAPQPAAVPDLQPTADAPPSQAE